MKGRRLLSLLVLSAFTTPVVANWQNADPRYTSSYDDNGARFVISARGGVAWGNAKIQNDIGAYTVEYMYNPETHVLATPAYCAEYDCDGFLYAGYAPLGDLPANKNYSRVSFAAGAGVGFTMPYIPQLRFEAGWDRISVAEYNVSPLFRGDLNLMGGDPAVGNISVPAESGSVQSNVSTDIVSIMAYYDFFSGNQKQVGSFVPYIGLGLGYADSLTELQLSDIYGDLSSIQDLIIYGDVDENNVFRFYKSSKRTSNVTALGALGISYGITERVFLDFSARVMYIPEIKWKLTNIDNNREKDWFSAKNMIYTNVMLGIRFEF